MSPPQAKPNFYGPIRGPELMGFRMGPEWVRNGSGIDPKWVLNGFEWTRNEKKSVYSPRAAGRRSLLTA